MNLNFTLLNESNKEVNPSEKYKGKNVVLYFYPRDNTPGCSLQATEFTSLKSDFEKLNTIVIGISKDSVKSHEKFCTKKSLEIELLSDENKEVCEQFGVWQLKKFMGKEFMGIVRSTFVFNEKHELIHEVRKVRTKGHQNEILKFIEDLQGE